MSDIPPAPAPRLFHPVTLLAGVVLGLVLLAWAGRSTTGRTWYRDFQRFHPLIAPESQYQPTIAEMRAIVRAKCRPDQILVIVGGNSIFYGVGQSVEKLWTRRLQELLGDRYCVVNFAFRGASPTDGGAIVAESLRDEFPRQILLANALPFTGASPAGSREYRYMMYDAYWKGWLADFPAREKMLRTYDDASGLHEASRDFSLSARLDAWLYFREFWNGWTITRGGTFPTAQTARANQAFRPRGAFADQELEFEAIPVANRFAERFLAAEMDITRATSGLFYQLDARGQWVPVESAWQNVREAKAAFPRALRARTLMVLCPNSPHYVQRMTPAEQARNALAYADSAAMWRSLGHATTTYGDGFTFEDFGDRTHLTASGGRKLAAHLAPEIRALATQLAYPNP